MMSRMLFGFTLLSLTVLPCGAADDAKPRLLFNGTDFTGWQTAGGTAVEKGWVIKEGTMAREAAGGDIWTKDRFGDFVLELEFKTAGNSGVFIRTDKPKDNVQTGIEIQVDQPAAKPGKHSVGALYDLVSPSKDNTKKADWNSMKVTAKGSMITVEINGEKVNEMDLDKWTTGGMNPDGTKNKYKTALKDFKREGYIGLQEHGANVSYRNIKITPLN